MAGMLKSPGNFTITPHKVSICILVQVYAPPSQISVPFPFSSVSHHNRLGVFLLSLTKACDGIFELSLDELIGQLRDIGGLLSHWLNDHLTRRLSSLASPDDLFNFFNDLRGILGSSDANVVDDDQIMLDSSSTIGMFVRRCLLAFNFMPFEGVCHLLTNIGTYCKESISDCPPYELSHLDDSSNDPESLLEYESMELENFVFEKVSEEFEARKLVNERAPSHNRVPGARFELLEDTDISSSSNIEHIDRPPEASSCALSPSDTLRGIDSMGGSFLRTNWQVQGYLSEQADAIEKHGSSFPLHAFESILRKLQKLAPELHRVHFLRYLNSLYHDDYPGALENLHRYFDYSAGIEGVEFVPPPSVCSSFGRYEISLLCLGMMHFHLGHPKQSLEVLTEAVRVSQQYSDDTCLAYTLAAICNLLSGIGFSNMTGIIGASYWPVAGIGTSSSVQQQLFVLLRRSLKRAESLKLKRLVSSIHLEIAKFDLTHVQRPLLSFGPNASTKLRTRPANICKELRTSYHLISDFGDETSIMTTDGAFCTAWLQNLNKPMGSLVFSQENETRSNSSIFHFCAQPSSIPGSVLNLLGSSYLVRATAWETYGSAPLARINSLVFATCFAEISSSSDAALAYAKLIQHLAVFKGYKG